MAVEFNAQTQQFVEELKQRPDVTGVLLFGSWARGNNRPDSDVDLMVFLTDGFKRRVEYNGTQAFEIIYTTEKSALDFWHSSHDECFRFWEIAQILFDKNGMLPALRAQAAAITAGGKPAFDVDSLARLRFDAEDELRAIGSILERDSTSANMLLTHKVFLLIELFFDVRQIWKPAPKQSLAEVKTISAEFYDLLQQFYHDRTTTREKLALARRMIPVVFNPLS